MFAAITPILFIGSVLGRISFKVWMVFVPLWITFAYCVNAFLVWGGGYWAGKGALDFSGGYVIHLAAGTSGFVAAAVIGPRLKRDRERAIPNNLLFVAVGAGILWLGWNGFNGGDPYFAGADAAAAVVNTNLATAVAMMTWIIMDMLISSEKKPTFLGGLNGMICGLVGITPAAGYVNGFGAIVIGLVCSAIVWVAWYYLPKYVWPFNQVDDALGVVYTHGIAGLFGGLLTGLLADPKMIVYLGLGKNPSISGVGLFYGHPKQLLIQLETALTIIIWDAAVTFVILMVIKHVFRMKLRLPTRCWRSATSRCTARRRTRPTSWSASAPPGPTRRRRPRPTGRSRRRRSRREATTPSPPRSTPRAAAAQTGCAPGHRARARIRLCEPGISARGRLPPATRTRAPT